MLKRCCLAAVFSLTGLLASGNPAWANQCGAVSIASLNWMSAQVVAHIDRVILSTGYGCTVEMSSGDAVKMFDSMNETGRPGLLPELWVSAMREKFDAALASGRITVATAVLADGGQEGWWIPSYVAEANPEIQSVEDALARPDLFPSPDDESAGAIFNCPGSWRCSVSTSNLFRAYDAEAKGFSLINTGSAAGLDASIAKAHEQEEGWLGYYWEPTPMLGKYEMVKLQMGKYEQDSWGNCIEVADCIDPKVNAWPGSDVLSIVSDDFLENAGDAIDYVSARQWDNKTINSLLAWMLDNQATGEEVAYHFLENHEELWSTWVPADIRSKVKAALQI